MATQTPASPVGTPKSKTMSPNLDQDDQEPAVQQIIPGAEDRSAPEDDKSECADDQSTVDDPPSKRVARVCGVCSQDPGKYKCSRPQCTMMYCSVACSRTHRDNHPPDPERAPEPEQPPAKDTKPKDEDPYRILLDHSSDIKRLFKKYPNLENDLAEILRATLPPPTDDVVRSGLPFRLQNPGGMGMGQKQKSWTRDLGLRNGAAALKKARTDPGDKGDGVRDYCELVLYLLSGPEGTKMENHVREEVLADDTEAVRRLMEEDRDRDQF